MQRGGEPSLSTIERSLLFSIAHNALTNVIRHAGADDVVIGLDSDGEELRLSVSDNGVGLPEDYEARGHGFRNMRADAQRVGGVLEVESDRDGGRTTVACVVPCRNLRGGEYMTTETRTSVMLVDDHQVMRDLLQDALENTGEFQVVAQAADGEEGGATGAGIGPGRDCHGRDHAGDGRHRGLPGDHGTATRNQGADTDRLQREGRHRQVHRRRSHRVAAEVLRQGPAAYDLA